MRVKHIYFTILFATYLFIYRMYLTPICSVFIPIVVATGDYITPHTGSRTILSYEANTQEDRFKSYTGMIVDCVIYLLFFAWLLIKGEPRFSTDSKNVASYRMYMKKADNEIMKVCTCYFYLCLYNRVGGGGGEVSLQLPHIFQCAESRKATALRGRKICSLCRI